jgi:flagellar protein FliO/FliZ
MVFAQAMAPVSDSLDKVSSVPSHSSYLVQVLLGLGFVLSLVFAIAWLIKRVGHGALVGGQQMQVLASLPLGTRERVLLVDVAGQQLLLGVAPGRISTLHTFSEPVVDVSARAPVPDFGKKLRELMGSGALEPAQSTSSSNVVNR